MSEPRGELARYAFGYSDRKPGWLFWVIHLAMVAFVLWAMCGHAQAHCYSVWKYPHAQRCGGNSPPVVRGIAKRMTVPATAPPQAPGPSFDIPLTDPDPLTMALKAQLK